MQNSIIDFIVNTKQSIAKQQNTELILDRNNLKAINIVATDLAIVLGNALDNAIEACAKFPIEKAKQVEIFVSLINEKVYITIKNPIFKEIDIDDLSSTKNLNIGEHGFGIISMKQIASKYNGEVLFSCKDRIFTTIIIMQNNILKK